MALKFISHHRRLESRTHHCRVCRCPTNRLTCRTCQAKLDLITRALDAEAITLDEMRLALGGAR